MSRTYRHSSIDHMPCWINRYSDEKWIYTRHRDGKSFDKAQVLTKEHCNWQRRCNDRILVTKILKGEDCDSVEYRDDKNLRGIIWYYD